MATLMKTWIVNSVLRQPKIENSKCILSLISLFYKIFNLFGNAFAGGIIDFRFIKMISSHWLSQAIFFCY